MTTRELLHCMACAKVTFWADAEMYVRTGGEVTSSQIPQRSSGEQMTSSKHNRHGSG